jgi:predicted nuclease of restriction endonuclease-like (RecB) superfamily
MGDSSDFYAKRDAELGWNRSALRAMLAGWLHERAQSALTGFDQSPPEVNRERDLSKALTDNLTWFLIGHRFAFVGAEVPIPSGDGEPTVDLLFYHPWLHRFVVFGWRLGRFEPEHVGELNFFVQLVDDHLRDQAHDDPTLGMLLVVGRDDVTVEVALRGVSTPPAVTVGPSLPAEVRQAIPAAEDFRRVVAQTFREIESTAPPVLPRFGRPGPAHRRYRRAGAAGLTRRAAGSS